MKPINGLKNTFKAFFIMTNQMSKFCLFVHAYLKLESLLLSSP